MPLEPSQRAALALYLVASRHLDVECCDEEGEETHRALKSAQLLLGQHANDAPDQVKAAHQIPIYLIAAGVALTRQHKSNILALRGAADLLNNMANRIDDSGDGDGHVLNANYCGGGFLELAHRIERRARDALLNLDLELSVEFQIFYVTSFAEDLRTIGKFCVAGLTDISRPRRTITILVRPEMFSARGLWHLTYTLHHELFCHALQGALASELATRNAHQTCHWTEGWVDTLVFDLVRDWLPEWSHRDWLPLRGEEARIAVEEIHDDRYEGTGVGIKITDMKHRRRARNAYRELVKVLRRYEFATSNDDARGVVERFTLLANTHENADCKRLRLIATRLLAALSPSRTDAPIGVAAACRIFSEDRDLGKLERTLNKLVELDDFA